MNDAEEGLEEDKKMGRQKEDKKMGKCLIPVQYCFPCKQNYF